MSKGHKEAMKAIAHAQRALSLMMDCLKELQAIIAKPKRIPGARAKAKGIKYQEQ